MNPNISIIQVISIQAVQKLISKMWSVGEERRQKLESMSGERLKMEDWEKVKVAAIWKRNLGKEKRCVKVVL